MRRLPHALSLIGVLGIGCGKAAPVVDASPQALHVSNGTTFNGISLSGLSVQKVYQPTTTDSFYRYEYALGSVDKYAGIGANGTSLSDGAMLDEDGLEELLDGLEDALEDVAISGLLEDGSSVGMELRDVEARDGLFYYFLRVNGEDLCQNADGQRVGAIAVPGSWDMRAGEYGGGSWSNDGSEMTFACEGSSIHKCVALGYRASVVNEYGKPEHLLACVRMLRADYCGNGNTWTTDGRMIEVWDEEGMHDRTMEAWPREARWTSNGAACLENPRLQAPEASLCSWWLSVADCDSHWTKFTLTSSFEPSADTVLAEDTAESSDGSTSGGSSWGGSSWGGSSWGGSSWGGSDGSSWGSSSSDGKDGGHKKRRH